MGNKTIYNKSVNDFSLYDELPSVNEWIKTQDVKTTKEIKIPEKLVDQLVILGMQRQRKNRVLRDIDTSEWL